MFSHIPAVWGDVHNTHIHSQCSCPAFKLHRCFQAGVPLDFHTACIGCAPMTRSSIRHMPVHADPSGFQAFRASCRPRSAYGLSTCHANSHYRQNSIANGALQAHPVVSWTRWGSSSFWWAYSVIRFSSIICFHFVFPCLELLDYQGNPWLVLLHSRGSPGASSWYPSLDCVPKFLGS